MRSKAKLSFVFGSLCLIGTLGISSHSAKASTFSGYNLPPYICSTGVGCCSAAGIPAIVSAMITGSGYSPDLQQAYYMRDLWPKIRTALQQLSDELRNPALFGIGPRGAFTDAQTFSQTMTSLNKQTSTSIATETPSEQICRFGTLSASLAKSDDTSRAVQMGLANQMLQREMMRTGMAASFEDAVGDKLGRSSDKSSRYAQYEKTFCDPKHSNQAAGTTKCLATTDARQDRDIDSTRSLYNPLTLNLDFSTAGLTADEENVMALASNLFAHDLPIGFGKADFEAILSDNGSASDSRKERLMDYRSIAAKRTVAQNSFAALAAMKAQGSGGSATYMKQMVGYLGLDAASQTALLGDNPSYYAQMELLTRKLYQSPEFYANLMESNANIARQQSAMEGIALMQDRDIHNSLKRSEMVLSTLLETYLAQQQTLDKDKGAK